MSYFISISFDSSKNIQHLGVEPIDGHTHDHDHGFWHCHVNILSAFSVTIPKTYNTWGLHGILKNHNLKQESHLNLQCLSIWYFLNPPPPVLFTLNDRKYFTMTSWQEFFIKVQRCYSADKYYFSAEYLLTILLNSCTRNNSASANHFCAGSFPPITALITYHFPLISSCHHTPDLTIFLSEISLERELLILPETNLEQKIFHWKDKMILVLLLFFETLL